MKFEPGAVSEKKGLPRPFWRWMKRFGVGMMALLLLLAASGAIYQKVASVQDWRRFPPPGELVDIDGHKLHMQVSGEGGPTVVLEAGLGGSTPTWCLVQPEIAKFTKVLSYDRAGTGWSDMCPAPRDGKQVTKELHALLQKAGLPGPYILVGYSLGGTYVRVFAHDYPNEVAGIILVDAPHEDQGSVALKSQKRDWSNGKRLMRLGQFLAPFGVARLFVIKPDPNIPTAVRETCAALFSRTQAAAGVYAEMLGIKASQDQVRGVSLGNLPLLVMSAGYQGQKPPNGMTVEDFNQFKANSARLQADLATRSSNSLLIAVTNSGHGVPFEQPGAIVDGVRRIVDAVRNNRPIKSAMVETSHGSN